MTNTYHRVGNGPHSVLVLHGWFGDAHSFEEIEPVARREILHYQARNSALRGMVKSAHFAQCKIDSIFLAI